MMFLEPQDGMSCREAQLLMSLRMKDNPILTQEQREAFEAHLMICSVCRQEYEEDKQLIVLLKSNAASSAKKRGGCWKRRLERVTR